MSVCCGLLGKDNRFHHAEERFIFLFSTSPSINANSDFKVYDPVRHIPLVSHSKTLPETQFAVFFFSFLSLILSSSSYVFAFSFVLQHVF